MRKQINKRKVFDQMCYVLAAFFVWLLITAPMVRHASADRITNTVNTIMGLGR